MKKNNLLISVLAIALLLAGALSAPAGTQQTPGPAPAKISRPGSEPNAAGFLERTAGGHVIGFGPREVIIGNGGYALRLDFIDSRGASPESFETGSSTGLRAPALGSVVYRDLWPGITLAYRGEKSGVAKSAWTVAPGAAVESIRLRANAPVRVDELGNLVYAFANGTMLESRPVAWQEIGGKRVPVDVSFRLDGEHEFGFTAAARDARYSLVIDPILTWNTFLGGAGNDESCNSMTLDSSGNIYIVGHGNGTWGTPIRAYAGNNYDAFVAKLSPNGTLLWNTFLGGDMSDVGFAIGLDANGNIYVSGQSNLTWGSPVRPFSTAAPDEFVAKLNPSGTLVWNTFLGGTGYDYNNSMAVDPGGNCYVVGASDASWGAPVNPFTAIPAGYKDMSIAKVDNNGYLQWNTFLGGTGNDVAYGVALDQSGGVYVSGSSRSSWGSPIDAYSGASDIALAKLAAVDGSLTWNTFLGQTGNDYGYGIAVSPQSILLVVGSSDATWGTPINPYGG